MVTEVIFIGGEKIGPAGPPGPPGPISNIVNVDSPMAYDEVTQTVSIDTVNPSGVYTRADADLEFATRESLAVNPLRAPLPLSAIADGQVHPLSEDFGTLAEAQATFPSATSLTQARDGVVIQELLNRGFNLDLPKLDEAAGHRFIVNGPILVPSFGTVLGRDHTARFYNPRPATDSGGSRQVFHTGLFHPSMWAHNGGTMVQDTIAQPALGTNVVTLTSNTIAFNVDDIVMVYDEVSTNPNPGLQGDGMINRIVGISGNDISLQYPLTKPLVSDPVVNGTFCHITNGTGGTLSYPEINATYGSYFAENIRLESLTVVSANGEWRARTALLEGVLENLRLISGRLIYGNADGACSYNKIRGLYWGEFSELGQGAHGNVFSDVRAASMPGAPASLQPAVRIGFEGQISNWRIEDNVDRPYVVALAKGQKFAHGVVSGRGLTTNMLRAFGIEDGSMEDITWSWLQEFTTGTPAIALGDPAGTLRRVALRDFTMVPPTTAKYDVLSLNNKIRELAIEGMQAPTGIVTYTSGTGAVADFDDLRFSGNAFDGFHNSFWAAWRHVIRGANNTLTRLKELMQLRYRSIGATAITATELESPALWEYQLIAAHTLDTDNILRSEAVVSADNGTNTKQVKLTSGATTVYDITLPALAGTFTIRAEIVAMSALVHHITVVVTNPDGTGQTTFTRLTGGGVDLTAGAWLRFHAWKSTTADAFRIRRFSWTPELPLT